MNSKLTPGKSLVFTVGGHNIGIDKYIKTRSDNKLKELYSKGNVYHGGFHFVSHVFGKENTVQLHNGQLDGDCTDEKGYKNSVALTYNVVMGALFL